MKKLIDRFLFNAVKASALNKAVTALNKTATALNKTVTALNKTVTALNKAVTVAVHIFLTIVERTEVNLWYNLAHAKYRPTAASGAGLSKR